MISSAGGTLITMPSPKLVWRIVSPAEITGRSAGTSR